MIYSILKTIFKKEEPKLHKYRDYKKFDSAAFDTDRQSQLEEYPKVCQNFKETFVRVLNAHAPRKAKVLRGNHKPHVDKNLRKAIMKFSALKRKASRTKQQEDIRKHKKQWNLVVKLNREMKFHYFNNLEISTNLKPFWDKCRLYFSNKHVHGDFKIILIEKNCDKVILVNNDEIAKTFNKHFAEMVKKLNTLSGPKKMKIKARKYWLRSLKNSRTNQILS